MRARLFVCASGSMKGKPLPPFHKDVCNSLKKSTGALGSSLPLAVSFAIDWLEEWSLLPTFTLNAFDYWNHLTSQMHFINQYPPPNNVDHGIDPSFFSIDAAIRLEHMKEGMGIIGKAFPTLSNILPQNMTKSNVHEGRGKKKKKVQVAHPQKKSDSPTSSIPCGVAWKIYDYFKQDFVCLKYEMPPQCLKEECKQ